MKKALAVVLSLLMAFSMFGVMAFAEGETTEELPPINVIFTVDGTVVQSVHVNSGEYLTAYVPKTPTKADTDTTRYTFKGWKTEGDDTIYYTSTLPVPTLEEGETSKTIEYYAVFAEEDISTNQSFLEFIKSVFERFNLILEYFATIFNF